MSIDGARFPSPVYAMDRTKSIERTPAHDQTTHQAGADEQVRIETNDALR